MLLLPELIHRASGSSTPKHSLTTSIFFLWSLDVLKTIGKSETNRGKQKTQIKNSLFRT